jgi:hypothetical protein
VLDTLQPETTAVNGNNACVYYLQQVMRFSTFLRLGDGGRRSVAESCC